MWLQWVRSDWWDAVVSINVLASYVTTIPGIFISMYQYTHEATSNVQEAVIFVVNISPLVIGHVNSLPHIILEISMMLISVALVIRYLQVTSRT